ncbi:sugar ABC transporter permease [Paenibacillus swuensis]|uniref:Sugar ABC transporter permease n=1 Tax=Paenibacillus swuensis TaxID=1178515 RepID=A0A172TP18_9BACL|nr:ABC transporter permease subunit [Paenibacillus swuensis]ANE48493.1 sugar ABC transporter permease [Paenibacillus swuensis]
MRMILRDLWRNKVLLAMMAPALLILLVNNYIPMFGVILAFKNYDYAGGILGSPWAGFSNFKFLFSSTDAWIITRNTVLYNVAFIIINLVLGVTFAILLNEIRSKFLSKLYQSAMFLPYFLSFVVVAYLAYSFLSPELGVLNKFILPWLGLEPRAWYTEAEYWPYILVLVNTWKGIGYFSIIYLAAIIGLDTEYYEAAKMDGANKWQQIVKITVPLLMPVMVIMTLLQIGKIFYSEFGLFYQTPRDVGMIYSTTNVIDTYVYRALMNLGDIGMASAAGLYQSVVGFVLILIANQIVRKYDKDSSLF